MKLFSRPPRQKKKSINCRSLNLLVLENLDLQLVENLETFKDLFDSAHDLIHIAHTSGELIYINHAWEKLIEFSQDEVRGKSIYQFVVDKDREKFMEYRNEVIQAKSVDKEVLVGLTTKTGKTVYIEGFVSVRLHNQKPVYTREFLET